MKKLILVGLLSVGVACANETEKCTSETCMTFYKEANRFQSLFERLFHIDDEGTVILVGQQFEKMCNAFIELTPKDIKMLEKQGAIKASIMAENCANPDKMVEKFLNKLDE